MKKMNICHVITRMIVGGAQENTLYSIIGHVQKGHDVTLVTGPSPGPEGKLLQNSNFPDFRIVKIPSLQRELNLFKDIKAYFELKKFFINGNFDVVHTHSSKAGIIGRAAAKAAKVPFVVHTVHGQAFHAYEKFWKNFLYITAERWAAKRCDKIYAVAQAMIDQCVAAKVAPREKYMVVYSGMEIKDFLDAKEDLELKKSLEIPEGAKVIGSVARLFPLKGYEYFIPAAAEILKKHPDTHFLIVGNGSMRKEIDKQLSDLNIADKFSFSGLVPPDQVCRYIAQMDILMHLSLREGLPRSVVQSLGCGKPAIGFALDGTPEMIKNFETGFIAPAKDLNAVIDGALKILDDENLARTMGENGRKMVAELFDWRRMCDILEQQYLEGLERKNA